MRSINPAPTVLLVEDDTLIALDLSDALTRAGYRTVGPVNSFAAAIEQVQRRTPDLAIVDVRLRDGLSSELACELRRRRVPFIVHSAWRRDASLCPELSEAPWLAKPAMPDDVVTTLSRLRQSPARCATL